MNSVSLSREISHPRVILGTPKLAVVDRSKGNLCTVFPLIIQSWLNSCTHINLFGVFTTTTFTTRGSKSLRTTSLGLTLIGLSGKMRTVFTCFKVTF